MARPLRIKRVGGRYHATARGNERRNIFRDDPDRFQFLELLSDMPVRFGVRLHTYVHGITIFTCCSKRRTPI